MKVAIFGATSAIAQATACNFAADGVEIALVARDGDRMETVKTDLEVRGARRVETFTADLADVEGQERLVAEIWHRMDGLDAVLVAYGTLGDQKASEASAALARSEFNTNALSPISLLTILANLFETRRSGCIAVIASVAGDRGRKTNYVYGAAKSALIAFTSGLRARMAAHNVSVVTIKPGFVDTPMTANIKKGPLFASAESVGKRIYIAMLKGEGVVYVPWFWAPIMGLIHLVPERLFRRLPI